MRFNLVASHLTFPPRPQILSYLGPKTLYELSFLSKTLYAILTSPTVKPVWKRAYTGLDLRDEKPEKPRTATAARLEKKRIPADSKNRQNKLPAFHGKEVVPYQLAVLMFDSSCQARPEPSADHQYLLTPKLPADLRRAEIRKTRRVPLQTHLHGLPAPELCGCRGDRARPRNTNVSTRRRSRSSRRRRVREAALSGGTSLTPPCPPGSRARQAPRHALHRLRPHSRFVRDLGHARRDRLRRR